MRYFISAGEASGDLHAAQLISALNAIDPEARFSFLGGDKMAAQSHQQPIIHYRQMAYMGFAEVIRHLPQVLGNLKKAKAAISENHPDALILVDYPSFNLKLAAHARQLNIPVYYYISPKVWAWKEHRVKQIRLYCRRILSILPFEKEYYRNKHNINIDYVGNPSLEEIDAKLAKLPTLAEFKAAHRLSSDRPMLAIVPGSRLGEIRNNLPHMLQAAERFPDLQPIIAASPGVDPSFYRQFTGTYPLVSNATFELMALSEAALVTSGTATLECALVNTPQVVCYRSNGKKWFFDLMHHFIKLPWVSLPNLIADKPVVTELLMHQCTADNIAARLAAIMPGTSGRRIMLDGYKEIRQKLGTSKAAATAASIIYNDLKH